MKKSLYLILVLGLVMTLGACSSSKKGGEGDVEDEFASDEIPLAEESESDAIPEDSLEEPGSFNEESSEGEQFAEEDGSSEFTDTSGDTAQAEVNDTPVDQGGYPEAGASSFSGSGQYTDYTVQKGDTLMKIAFETYGDIYQWRRVYEANQDKLADPNNIPAGMVIRVEQPASPVVIERNGEPYQIKSGDTLASISQDVYGTSRKWRKIWDNNRQLIRDPNKIYAGFYVYYTFNAEDEQLKQQLLSQSPQSTESAAVAPSGGAPEQPAAPATEQPVNTVDSERIPAAQE